jgi:hypothetical protein
VDDIVFGGSSHSLVARFAEDMSKEFEMSMMGESQFFLELQIKQAKEGIFVHQAKYTKDILKKFKMDDSKPLSTSMSITTALDTDEDGEPVDQKEYRSMVGSLLYLTETRPASSFLCVCALVFRRYRGLATPGFESTEFPHKVYRLRKAVYGLKQAPHAWYGRLRGFLFSKWFEMGKVDKTHFLLR